MQRSDYLVTALPLTPGTKRIFSSEVFSSAKSGQVFINVGRGGLVDDAALIEALSNGTLRGAASDVFSEEPLPADSPYWDLPNLIISPHNADQTVDFRHRAVRAFTENCKLFLKGEDFDSVVDLSRGY